MSHEHEGPGGVLEQHDSEAQRLAALWKTGLDQVKMAAWQKPKSDRRRLLNAMLQMSVNFILCFRAKEKMNLSGPKPKPLGWMPIAGEEFVYEMTVNCLLYPNAGGVPSWQPDEMGEKAIIKLPGQFRGIFKDAKAPLSEDIGRQLADWAAGGSPATKASASVPEEREPGDEPEDQPGPDPVGPPTDTDCDAMVRIIESAANERALRTIGEQHWPKGRYMREWTAAQRQKMSKAYSDRQAALRG
jgi:hypothetical protein